MNIFDCCAYIWQCHLAIYSHTSVHASSACLQQKMGMHPVPVPGKKLDEQIVADEHRQKIEKEIAKLEKQARTEKQPKKKFELVQRVKALKKLIKELNG